MGSLGEIMQLCRLCLVKDKVNIPIFEGAGDIRKISHKISACLPVKVAKDDKLPKKICDGCSLKLDVIYQFWNTSTASEKQLLEWVNNPSSLKGESQDSRANVAEHIVLKQEIDNGDSEALDAGEFIDVNDSFENIGYTHDDDDDMSNENIAIKTENDSQSYIEPPRKKQKVVSLSSAESEEDADDPSDAYNRDDSDEEDNDISDAQPTFVNVSDADQQPGPSGVGKSSGDAPAIREIEFVKVPEFLPEPMKTKKKIYTCDVCTKSFISRPAYAKHKIYYKDKIEQHQKLFDSPDRRTGYRKCEECPKVCLNEESLKLHVNHAHRGQRVICSLCSKDFSSKANLKGHMKTHDDPDSREKFSCELCSDKIFITKASLRHHVQAVHDPVTFVCDVCGKVFSSKGFLGKHMVTHSEHKKHMCDVCGKRFTKKEFLKLHSVVHTKIKEYKCKQCDKCYSQRSSLNIHIKNIHMSERPFECYICNKTFISVAFLNFHLKTHNMTNVETVTKIKHRGGPNPRYL